AIPPCRSGATRDSWARCSSPPAAPRAWRPWHSSCSSPAAPSARRGTRSRSRTVTRCSSRCSCSRSSSACSAPPRSRSPPVSWSAERCRETWGRGVPLAAEARPRLDAAHLEDLLGDAMEAVAALDPARAPALQRLAGAWDAGALGPQALLPRREGIGDGSIEAASRLDAAAVAFLAYATLRPVLEAWLAPTRPHFADAHWGRGVCPFCGAPPGFVDVIEGGHRRLACHFCGGAWSFAKLRCPLCGVEGTTDLQRPQAE